MTGPRAGRPGTVETATTIETLVARLLVAGTYLAVALLVVGVLGMLAAGVDPLSPAAPTFDPSRLAADAGALRPEGFLWAGLLLVIALPIGRVVVSGLSFLAARDRRFALLSLLVLLVVLASVVAAVVGQG